MLKKLKTIIPVILLMLLIVLAQGCKKQEADEETAEAVHAFKITRKQELTKPGQAQDKGVAKPVVLPVEVIKAGAAPKSKEPAPIAKAKPLAKAAEPAKKETPTVKDLLPDEDLPEPSGYNPAGRVDPFAPLFKAKSTPDTPATSQVKTMRETRLAMLTPLEKVDISQLKLVGIVTTPTKKMAMVEEATGRGHVIKEGTYIGTNSGKVVEILENRVVIEEEIENFLGKIVLRKRELKLQKPLGEE